MRDGLADERLGLRHLASMLCRTEMQVNEATTRLSNQNRSVPLLTKIEMAPFCVLRLFVLVHFFFLADFCKKISRPEALRATIRFGLDLEHPAFFRPLACAGVQPCGARRAERLGRSVGPSQRCLGHLP